jgi:hypothetical protein
MANSSELMAWVRCQMPVHTWTRYCKKHHIKNIGLFIEDLFIVRRETCKTNKSYLIMTCVHFVHSRDQTLVSRLETASGNQIVAVFCYFSTDPVGELVL